MGLAGTVEERKQGLLNTAKKNDYSFTEYQLEEKRPYQNVTVTCRSVKWAAKSPWSPSSSKSPGGLVSWRRLRGPDGGQHVQADVEGQDWLC